MPSDSNSARGVEPSPKVLVVDEDANDAKIFRLILEGQGIAVSTCITYEAAVESLETGAFDFILVSQGTTAFEGRIVLERAKQLDRKRPVLVVTRSMNIPCYLEAMQLGAIDYLEKPIAPGELLRFVRTQTLQRRTRTQGATQGARPNL